MVDALELLCERHGIRLWRGSAVPGTGEPPGIVGELAAEIMRSGDLRPETVTRDGRRLSRARSAEEISAELSKLVSGLPKPGTRRLPAIDPELDRCRLIDACCRALLRETETRPLLVVFENLEAADALSADVYLQLRRMLWNRRRSRPRVRLLLVATWDGQSSPGFIDGESGAVAASSAFHIDERGFTRDDTQMAAHQTLGRALSVTEGERLRKLTDGSVLLTLWILRLWREGGPEAVERLNTKKLDLRMIVRERLKFLEADQKRCLQLLAAVGVSVPKHHLLVAASVTSESSFVELAAGDWVSQNARGETVILNEQIREVILEELDAEEREKTVAGAQQLCEKLARNDKRLLPRSLSLALEAGRSSSDSSAAMNAVNYLVTAGCADRALELVEAVAAECVENRHPRQREWRARLADFLEQTGNQREAIEVLSVLRDEEQSAERRAECSRRIGGLLGALGEYEEQLRAYYSGLRVVLDNDASRVRAELLACVARSHAAAGQEAEAQKFLELYTAAVERFEDLEPLSEDLLCAPPTPEESTGGLLGEFQSLAALVDCRIGKGSCKRGSRSLRRLLSCARKSGSRVLIARALCRVGRSLRVRGEKERALSTFRRANRLFADCGRVDEAWTAQTQILILELKLSNLGAARRVVSSVTDGWPPAALDAEGKLDLPPAISHRELAGKLIGSERVCDAEKMLEQELHASLGGRSPPEAGSGTETARASQARGDMLKLLALGRLSCLRGDYDTAMERVLRCLSELESAPDRCILAAAYLEVGELLVERGEMRRAEHHLLRAFELAARTGGAREGAAVFAALSRFFLEVGADGLAGDLLDGALSLVSGIETDLAPRLCRLRSRLAIRRGDLDEARGHLEQLGPELEAAGDRLEICRHFLEYGWLEYRMDRLDEASELARRGVELARAMGCEPMLDDSLLLVGVVEGAGRQGGNFLRAIEALDQALAGAQSRRRPRLIWESLGAMSQIYRQRGKADLAGVYRDRARAVEVEVFAELPPGWRWPSPVEAAAARV